jgi:hypothetical protein
MEGKLNPKYPAIFFALMLMLSVAGLSTAQVTLGGGKGTLRIYDSETVYPGLLYINMTYLAYAYKTNRGVEEDGGFAEDHTMNVGFTFGLSKKLELLALVVPYQDDQRHIWGPPGDSKIGLKYHFPRQNSMLQFGLVGFATFPTATLHNVAYEPFSVKKSGWGLLGVATFDFKNSSPGLPLKISLNLGYRDLDWSDRFFQDKKDLLVGGFGLKFPIRSSVLFSEISGEIFVNNSEQVSFSQNLLRFTQGLRFLGPWHLIFDIAGDFELGAKTPDKATAAAIPYIKDYADWKFVLGASYQMTVFKYMTREDKAARQQQKAEQNKLDSIRQKREKAAKELEEMKKNLEKDKRNEPDNN